MSESGQGGRLYAHDLTLDSDWGSTHQLPLAGSLQAGRRTGTGSVQRPGAPPRPTQLHARERGWNQGCCCTCDEATYKRPSHRAPPPPPPFSLTFMHSATRLRWSCSLAPVQPRPPPLLLEAIAQS